MLTVINLLVIFFMILITSQIILARNDSLIEGLTGLPPGSPPNPSSNSSYQPYNTNNEQNALVLAQQNAGNIEYLKGRIEDIQSMSLYKQVQDLSGNILTLQEQVGGLVTAQKEYANQMTGGVAPDISGATSEEPDETSDLVT